MVKFLYIIGVSLTCFILFIFSTHKEVATCTNQIEGIVVPVKNDKSLYAFGIETPAGDTLLIKQFSNRTVLAEGAKITICYSPVKTESNREQFISLESVLASNN